jgi:hypothetical protein
VVRASTEHSVGVVVLARSLQSGLELSYFHSGNIRQNAPPLTEDLRPILKARPELIESLTHTVAKMQQFVNMFDQSAIQPAVIEPHDLLWRSRNFFRLNVESSLKESIHTG